MTSDIKSLFIVDESQVIQNNEKLIEKALKYGRITKNGNVIIDKTELSQDNTLKLALVIRFLAHTIDETISATVRPTEMIALLGERIESVGSRLSHQTKAGFLKKTGYGQYMVNHYKIEGFLNELESDEPQITAKTARPKRKNSGTKTLTGIGLHIQHLVEDGFFSTPKEMSAVIHELAAQNVHRDPRVIDKTMRDIFVTRKILSRIENKDKGKAKWLYVNYK